MKNYLFLFLLFIPTVVFAETSPMHMMSGTGFFVNKEYLITNAHVVNGCSRVAIHGPITLQSAIVDSIDAEHDLALLKTITPSVHQTAPMRFDLDTMQPGDKVFLIGFPGIEGANGKYKFVEAEVPALPANAPVSAGRFFVSDNLEHGDSGGPVFDIYGNVIGVMVAKTILYSMNVATGEKIPQFHLGVIINLDTVKAFLSAHSVYTQWVGSGSRFVDPNIEENARNYIVNILCRTDAPVPENANQ